jgi:hypothetical protein
LHLVIIILLLFIIVFVFVAADICRMLWMLHENRNALLRLKHLELGVHTFVNVKLDLERRITWEPLKELASTVSASYGRSITFDNK